ncbi:MAG: hypothetical protein QT02_C0011G0025 [archaeon GW2011_AR9]|nr:MAG: hypothetical protein QT02_C0011G0025 [archaeon GW2011_AR9]
MFIYWAYLIKRMADLPEKDNKRILDHTMDVAYNNIREILEKARLKVVRAVNSAMVYAYWEIGRVIVEEEQKGKERAEYGANLLKQLSIRLRREFGSGFDESNLRYIRLFYLKFPNCDALRHELTWTHYRVLIKIERDDSRNFYLNETINSKWSTRELERQINSLLYERLTVSKDKEKVKELSLKGQLIEKPEDLIKDPYVLEFLGLKVSSNYLEKELEKALISKLKDFLLELGKGFSFVERQRRITVDGEHYYIDLVFYNYILKCFFLIDLKIGKLTTQNIGQMDFYVRYFEKEEKLEGDNPTIGLILCSDKNEVMAKYTLLSEGKNIFASKYRLYLPTEEELKRELIKERGFILREQEAEYK